MIITVKSKKHGDKEILIDDEDYDKVKNYTWTLGHETKQGHFYVVSSFNKISVF